MYFYKAHTMSLLWSTIIVGVRLWQVLVASPGKGMQLDRIQLAAELWDADIAAEFGYKANPNFKDSLQYADAEGIPFLVILGESEKQEVRGSNPHFIHVCFSIVEWSCCTKARAHRLDICGICDPPLGLYGPGCLRPCTWIYSR